MTTGNDPLIDASYAGCPPPLLPAGMVLDRRATHAHATETPKSPHTIILTVAVVRATGSERGGAAAFLHDSDYTAERTLANLAHYLVAASFGGDESLDEVPAAMAHAGIPREAREAAGIVDSLIRHSVGIEDTTELKLRTPTIWSSTSFPPSASPRYRAPRRTSMSRPAPPPPPRSLSPSVAEWLPQVVGRRGGGWRG